MSNPDQYLCESHKNEKRLDEPIQKRCLIHCNPTQTSPVYYENAQICEDCAINTDSCQICQDGLYV